MPRLGSRNRAGNFHAHHSDLAGSSFLTESSDAPFPAADGRLAPSEAVGDNGLSTSGGALAAPSLPSHSPATQGMSTTQPRTLMSATTPAPLVPPLKSRVRPVLSRNDGIPLLTSNGQGGKRDDDGALDSILHRKNFCTQASWPRVMSTIVLDTAALLGQCHKEGKPVPAIGPENVLILTEGNWDVAAASFFQRLEYEDAVAESQACRHSEPQARLKKAREDLKALEAAARAGQVPPTELLARAHHTVYYEDGFLRRMNELRATRIRPSTLRCSSGSGATGCAVLTACDFRIASRDAAAAAGALDAAAAAAAATSSSSSSSSSGSDSKVLAAPLADSPFVAPCTGRPPELSGRGRGSWSEGGSDEATLVYGLSCILHSLAYVSARDRRTHVPPPPRTVMDLLSLSSHNDPDRRVSLAGFAKHNVLASAHRFLGLASQQEFVKTVVQLAENGLPAEGAWWRRQTVPLPHHRRVTPLGKQGGRTKPTLLMAPPPEMDGISGFQPPGSKPSLVTPGTERAFSAAGSGTSTGTGRGRASAAGGREQRRRQSSQAVAAILQQEAQVDDDDDEEAEDEGGLQGYTRQEPRPRRAGRRGRASLSRFPSDGENDEDDDDYADEDEDADDDDEEEGEDDEQLWSQAAQHSSHGTGRRPPQHPGTPASARRGRSSSIRALRTGRVSAQGEETDGSIDAVSMASAGPETSTPQNHRDDMAHALAANACTLAASAPGPVAPYSFAHALHESSSNSIGAQATSFSPALVPAVPPPTGLSSSLHGFSLPAGHGTTTFGVASGGAPLRPMLSMISNASDVDEDDEPAWFPANNFDGVPQAPTAPLHAAAASPAFSVDASERSKRSREDEEEQAVNGVAQASSLISAQTASFLAHVAATDNSAAQPPASRPCPSSYTATRTAAAVWAPQARMMLAPYSNVHTAAASSSSSSAAAVAPRSLFAVLPPVAAPAPATTAARNAPPMSIRTPFGQPHAAMPAPSPTAIAPLPTSTAMIPGQDQLGAVQGLPGPVHASSSSSSSNSSWPPRTRRILTAADSLGALNHPELVRHDSGAFSSA